MKKGFLIVLTLIILAVQIPIIPATKPITDSKQLQVSLSDSKISDKQFDILMKIYQHMCQSPSLTVGYLKNDSLVWYKSYGYCNLKEKRVPDKNTMYLIGSVTKTITATAYMQLYEKGSLDLDSDINTYLNFSLRNPKAPDDPITFRELLSHRSGICDHCIFNLKGMISTLLITGIPDDMELFIKEFLIPGGAHYSPDYWLDTLPGTYEYSSVGYAVLGYLFEKVSKQSLESYCQEHIFNPLEMYNTSFHPDEIYLDRMATPYIRKCGKYIALPNFDAKALASAGGVRTSLEDLSHYLIAHMNNGSYKGYQMLKNETIQLMHDCIYIPASNGTHFHDRYGLGWAYVHKDPWGLQGHGGMIPGGNAMMWFNETSRTGFIIMTNEMDILCFFEPIDFGMKKTALYGMGLLLMDKATNS